MVGRSEQEQGGEGQKKRDENFLELWQQMPDEWHKEIVDTLVRLQDYERLFRLPSSELAVSASLKSHI